VTPEGLLFRDQLADELRKVLPLDLPRRDFVITGSAAHLERIVEANQHLNLTRITSPREAAIKHVLDSVIPWQLFAGARHVLDAGTGPGFPGIPLALLLPEVRFTLAESIQKKARFLESALAELASPNATMSPRRAEDLWRDAGIDIITARAFAPISRTLELFGGALKAGIALLLYKGPDVEREMEESSKAAAKLHVRSEVVMRYDLPDSLGTRTIVKIAR
jgi:16S rRNA (guanine527-N7)-methyltransferase